MQGLADDEVCVGDRYQIGDAVIEVTQPRVTCCRVGIRINDPRIPAMLVSHHRPGFYFRVLRCGAERFGVDVGGVDPQPRQSGTDLVHERRGPAQVCLAIAGWLKFGELWV